MNEQETFTVTRCWYTLGLLKQMSGLLSSTGDFVLCKDLKKNEKYMVHDKAILILKIYRCTKPL